MTEEGKQKNPRKLRQSKRIVEGERESVRFRYKTETETLRKRTQRIEGKRTNRRDTGVKESIINTLAPEIRKSHLGGKKFTSN